MKAITQLQHQLAEKDEQLRKKNEILALLKQRFLQFQETKSQQAQSNAASSGSVLAEQTDAVPKASVPPSAPPRAEVGSPSKGGWEAAKTNAGLRPPQSTSLSSSTSGLTSQGIS